MKKSQIADLNSTLLIIACGFSHGIWQAIFAALTVLEVVNFFLAKRVEESRLFQD